MIRDTGLLYELSCNLKDHHFITCDKDDFVSDSQLERICQYLDDIVIDLFFHYNAFKPIVVPKGLLAYRQSVNGPIDVDPEKEIVLSLNNVFDRYTFINAFLFFCMKKKDTSYEYISNNGRQFLWKLKLDYILYSAFGRTILIKDEYPYHPFLDDFKFEYRNFDFGKSKAQELYKFRDYMMISPNNT